jgi:hypothetical protein
MTRPAFVGTVPEELRPDIAYDVAEGDKPEFLVIVGETSVRVATRPSPSATWGPPVVLEKA